jgi:hypothetical protein
MNKTAYDTGAADALGLLGLSKLARFSLELRPEMRARSQKGDYDIIRQPKSNANNPKVSPDSRVSQSFDTLHDNSLHDPYATVF